MEYPRVTEILRVYTNYDKVPPQILSNAASRGTTVHALCAGIAKGEWIPDGMIGEEYAGYVKSFRKWADAQVVKFVVIEKRYADEAEQFTGQLDFVIQGTDEQLHLVDIKTSARPQKTYPIQMAAYDKLLRNHKIDVKSAMLVYLDKDGEFPEIQVLDDLTEELHVFHAALDCWHYFNKGKSNGKRKTSNRSAELTDCA